MRSFVHFLVVALLAAVTYGSDLAQPKTEQQLIDAFRQRFHAKDVDGIMTLYDTAGTPPAIVALAKRVLNEHISRGRPIVTITITPISPEDAKAVAQDMPFGSTTLRLSAKPDRMLTAVFEGGSELSAFKAPVAETNGVVFFPMAKPIKTKN